MPREFPASPNPKMQDELDRTFKPVVIGFGLTALIARDRGMDESTFFKLATDAWEIAHDDGSSPDHPRADGSYGQPKGAARRQPDEPLEDFCPTCGDLISRHFTPCHFRPDAQAILRLLVRLDAEGKRPAAIRVLARHMASAEDDGKRVMQSIYPDGPQTSEPVAPPGAEGGVLDLPEAAFQSASAALSAPPATPGADLRAALLDAPKEPK